MPMEARILGPLALIDGEDEVSINGSKVRALLALLLVRANEVVSAERLADDLWGDAIPAGYVNGLQSLVSRLRRALGADGRMLATTANGYRIDIDPALIDANRFVDAVRRGRDSLAQGRHAEAADDLRDALALWRGPALAEFDDDGLLRREAVRLDELRLGAIEDRIDADLHLGRHLDVIAELGVLTATNPLRERLHGLLMLALYRAGRQAEALRAFQTAREVLADELGLDPGVELKQLESAILAQDPTLDLAVPPRRDQPPVRTNLWRELSTFVGRADDVAALTELSATTRLTTVVGPGGAGKTRLAVEAAMARVGREDVWFVDLAPLQSGDAVAETVAAVIGVSEPSAAMGAVSPMAGRPMHERIADHVGAHSVLILLDNCEHVIRDAARVSEQLLVVCPGLRILATSREALGVRGEVIWPVPPMSTEDAVELFTNRAASMFGMTFGDDLAADVVEVCERLDGLPLAIELAVGRVRAIPVRQLASRLDDRFRLLTGGSRTALPRQQTLRAVVEWSFELLFDDEQRVFARMSAFAGGCTLEAAEAVCSDDQIATEDVADLLAHLVDKSLVVVERGDERSDGAVRYRMLQTLELYGRERLAASGEADRVRARHADHFGDVCRRGFDAFRGREDQTSWLEEVHRDDANIRMALQWLIDRDDTTRAQTALAGLGWRWWFAGRSEEGWRLLERVYRLEDGSSAIARGAVGMWTAYAGAVAGVGMPLAAAIGEEAVVLLSDAEGDVLDRISGAELLGWASALLGDIYAMSGNRPMAIRHTERAIELFERNDDSWSQGMALDLRGQIAEMQGDVQLAFDLVTESLPLLEASRVDWALVVMNGDAGMLASRLTRYDDAFRLTDAARHVAHRMSLGGMEALLLSRLAGLTLRTETISAEVLARAEGFIDEAIAVAEGGGFRLMDGFGHAGRAIVRRLQSRFDEAVDSATHAASRFEATGLRLHLSQAISTLGFVALHRDEIEAARAHFRRALQIARESGGPRSSAIALEGLAGVALRDGDPGRAAFLLGAARRRLESDGGGPTGPASDAVAIRERAVAELGAEQFERRDADGFDADLDTLPELDA